MKNKIATLLTMLLLCLAVSGLAPGTAQAAGTIYWTEEQSAVYSPMHPYTLNWSGDVLDRGGLNLSTLDYTRVSPETDIVINQYGDIGALSIRKLGKEELTDPTVRYTSGFTNSLKIEQGALYLVMLQDGTYAKLLIDRILPDNGLSITQVRFSYVFEAEEEVYDQGGDDYPLSLDIGSPAEDALNPLAEYEFEGENAITIPWTQLPGEYMWDIYRSDNGAPYVRMTDFMLTETEYTDHYTFIGHTYLYKLVSYDEYGELIDVSGAIKVTIVPEGGGQSADDADGPQNQIVLQIGNKTAYVNNKAHTLEAAPSTYNGRAVIPLRFVSEALGAGVKWNGKERSITITLGQDTIVLVLDQSAAKVNGKTVMMDVPAIMQGKVTMVPIRFVSDQLKHKISFDNVTKKIVITSPADAGSAGGSGSSGANSGSETQASAGGSAYFTGTWKMYVPGGADGRELTIHEDGTISFYWNGAQTGTWTYDEVNDKLLLTNYKSGWDWTVTRTDTGITVSTYGVYETGTRID
ncbi:copper amine oxidase N-terminal domain-containing protein [Paenibacillus abyssi]|uniref:Copper amine oxidase-like N-terminal domain-containing protein n=1 Tax=Paenibacillus abyssi TaxID=1340531 RepID=A0A917FVN8_9BACL|nr:copper amine oxidase N-terminal domain-containing protein [Paenibacillus abyssi]GGG05615.1 hypothetical protein GCM10010916_23300 [Paenibacillus abyssi]